MGESVFEGTLTRWLKKVGEPVVRDEPLFEISTDKVDSEIPAPASGILTKILVPEGSKVQINTVVAVIDGAEGAAEEAQDDAGQPAAGEGRVGASPDAAVFTPGTPAPEAPVPPPGTAPAEEPVRGETPPATAPAAAPAGIGVRDIRTSPLVRRLARENDVDLARVRGTGLDGRITKDDLLAYITGRTESETKAAGPGPAAGSPPAGQPRPLAAPEPPAPAAPRFVGESERVPMSVMRKAIAEHMVRSKRTSAHVNTVFEVDVSPIVRLRESHKAEFEAREGVALTYTPFFAKALVDTVRDFPAFNSSIEGEEIVYKKPVNLGVAVALESGLIVPVVRDAQLKSFTGLVLAIHDLAERARTKRLKPEDVQNGTISMTNPGSYGSLFNTPVINQPQVAILGIGGIEKRPVVIEDAIAIRSMVCLSLSFDHRVIDGAVADRFMAKLKSRLQSWGAWMD